MEGLIEMLSLMEADDTDGSGFGEWIVLVLWKCHIVGIE
jgi:hypothetical protein